MFITNRLDQDFAQRLLFSEQGPDRNSVTWTEHGLWVGNKGFSLGFAACHLGRALTS